jgi:hypothetical protein
LPTKDEWSAAIAHAKALGCLNANQKAPSLTNDAGTDCKSVGPSSFAGVISVFYWSSTATETNPSSAWATNLTSGTVFSPSIPLLPKSNSFRVWPVRGGPR